MRLYSSLNSMKYGIAYFNKNVIEFDGVNCDTCKIYINDMFFSYYNFNTNVLSCDYFEKDILKFEDICNDLYSFLIENANTYFLKLYKQIYKYKIKNGGFLPPFDDANYYLDKINKCKENIENEHKRKIIFNFQQYYNYVINHFSSTADIQELKNKHIKIEKLNRKEIKILNDFLKNDMCKGGKYGNFR